MKAGSSPWGGPATGTPASPWSGAYQALFVAALCLGSRLATTIHHIEDADSLRFALAMADFDVTRLQPQFPGYPVFCFAAKTLYALLGSYALAFSALGGLGLFVLADASLRILGWRASEARGAGLIALFLFNPMLWLLGNRYMSDLSGAALGLAAFLHLARACGPDSPRLHAALGFFLAGLQAGWRLSYLPFLFLPLGAALLAPGRRVERLLAGVAGMLVWVLPLIAITGWRELLDTARLQTSAHFYATGGTYHNEPDWILRLGRMVGNLWTDGLGAWWPDRHAATWAVSAGAAVLLVFGAARLRREGLSPALRLLLLSSAAYAVWILIFQNVVHQTRHVLPLVPPLLLVLAAGLPREWREWRDWRPRGMKAAWVLVVLAFLAAYAFVGTSLALQHLRPAAIAQALSFLKTLEDPKLLVVGAPWVQKCLSAQGLKMDYLAVETPEELEALSRLDPARPLITVGDYSDRIRRPVLERRAFFHNPFVNRLGSRVEVLRLGPAPTEGEP